MYLAFGDGVAVIASQSLPSAKPCGVAARAMYVAVVLLTFPLQLFPVTDIVARGEAGPRAGALRVTLVLGLALLALTAQHKLDHVVSLAGAVACAPLALVVGPWMHLSVATTARGRWVDRGTIAVGWAIAAGTTANCVATWGAAAS